MPGTEENQDRHAIPRLRSFASALDHGEVSSLAQSPPDNLFPEFLDEVLRDWHLEPSVFVAADLISSARVVGNAEIAREAARFVLGQQWAPTGAKKMAAVYLGEANPLEIAPGVRSVHSEAFQLERIRQQIHRIRQQLHIYPADAILWTNLASLYLSLGQGRQAERSIRAALTLAGQNRFVLRAAARILLHLRRGGEALFILRRAHAVRIDPWLLSAELSITASLGQKSEYLIVAQRALEAETFSPIDGSELAAEMATIQALHNNTWGAKKFLKRALVQPCENALAQAAWLARIPGMPAMPVVKTTSSEANAWRSRQEGKFRETILETERWQSDQPFSHMPAQMGSFVAGRVERHEDSIRFAEQGLICNPGNPILLNNLAFSAARQGQLEKAKTALQLARRADMREVDRQTLMATEGLIAFREGDPELGRRLYRKAIKAFHEGKDIREAVANAYLVIEEVRAGARDCRLLLESAIRLAKEKLVNAEDLVLVKQLDELGSNKSTVSSVQLITRVDRSGTT